jgi:CDP-diglyceride synthetase
MSNSEKQEYAPRRLSPDLTLLGTVIGVFVGVVLATTVFRQQAHSVLIFTIGVGWTAGFVATISSLNDQ